MTKHPLGNTVMPSCGTVNIASKHPPVIIRECTISPGNDGSFVLALCCECGGITFGGASRINYDVPLDELTLSNTAGENVTVTSRDISNYLAAGYDFERESYAYLSALNPNTPPRIAFTVRNSTVMGGRPIILYRYINWLADLGVDVTVYSDDFPPPWTTLNARFRRIPDDQQRYAAISEPVVIIYSIFEVPHMLRHGDTRGKRIYHLCQGAEDFHFGKPLSKDLLYPIPIFDILNSLPVGRIVVSSHLERYFAKKYRQRTTTIINGINLDTFSPAPKPRRSDSFTVLVSGNPRLPLKGVTVVHQALANLAIRHPDWTLHLVNVCGEQLPNAGDRQTSSSNSKISYELLCGLTPEEMRDAYYAADVYVNAPWYGGFGLPTLEAMASGTPVIHTDNHGLDAIVEDEKNCLMVQAGDHEAVAAALEKLFTDRDLYQRLIEAGLKTAAHFPLQRQHDMLVAAFSTISGLPLERRHVLPAGVVSKPLFSVLVPCYNQAHFLSAALDSLLAQTYGNWEAIVVNDGSTDATALVMEKYAASDPRIRCFHKQNGGVASALNRGISEAHGEWLCWLSSDDLFLPEKLAIHRDTIAADPGLRFMYTNYLVLYEDSGAITPAPISVKDFIPPQELQLARFFDINYFNGISIAIHRNVFSIVGVFNEEYQYGQDFDLWMRISARFRSRFIDIATCITRIHPGQGTNLFSEAGIYDSARAALDFLNRNRFEAIFPQLALSQPEQAVHAIGTMLRTILNRAAFINCCGFGQALVDRLHEWLTNQVPATVRSMLVQAIKALLMKITPEQSQVLLPVIADTTRGFTYEMHDAYVDLKRYVTVLEQNGNDQAVVAIRRYLDMIISASSQVQQAAQETSNHVESNRENMVAADKNLNQRSVPYFTVIVPTYNQACYLPAALDSLLAQSFSDWEAVVVNDGSTDATAQVLESYSARDRRIRIFHQENGGVAAALNTGLRHARGEWICWLSSDDLFEPEKLQIHAEAVAQNPAIRFMYSNFTLLFDETGARNPGTLNVNTLPSRELQMLSLFKYNYINGISIAVHREVFERVGSFDTLMKNGQDFDMWLKIGALYPFYFINRHTSITRIHAGQGTNLFVEAGIYDSCRACLQFLSQNTFPTLFPFLDLSCKEHALFALQHTAELLATPHAYINRTGGTPALMDRLKEWLAALTPELAQPMHALLEQIIQLVGNAELPEELKQKFRGLGPMPKQFSYQQYDFFVLMRQQLKVMQRIGNHAEVKAIEKYLAAHADTPTPAPLQPTELPPKRVKPLSILYVVQNFPPTAYGGVEVYTYNLALEMGAMGQRVTILYPEVTTTEPLYSIAYGFAEGFTVARLRVPPGNLVSSVSSPDIDEAFKNFIQTNSFDVVHFQHTYINLSMTMIRVARNAGMRVAVILHDFWYICPRTHLFIDNTRSTCSGPETAAKCSACLSLLVQNPQQNLPLIEQLVMDRQATAHGLLNDIDLIFAPSRFVADVFQRHGYGAGKIIVAPIGLRPIQIRRSASTNVIRFGYLGNSSPLKNIQTLVDAFSTTTGPATLDLFGGGESVRDYNLFVRKHDQRITYHGRYTPEHLPAILSRIDVLVVPSFIESYCLTLREALIAGIPVIAAAAGGILDIVQNGVNGILFDPHDTEALTRLIQQIILKPSQLRGLNPMAVPVRTIAEDAGFLLQQYSPGTIETTRTSSSPPALRCSEVTDITATVSIIIPVYNQVAYTKRCLEMLYANTPASLSFEVIVVDNASTDDTAEFLNMATQRYRNLRVIQNNENLLFAKACNQGGQAAHGEYLVFLNNDTEPLPRWLDQGLARLKSDPAIGVVGSKLLYPDGTVQHCGIEFIVCPGLEPPYNLWPKHRFLYAAADDPRVNISEEVFMVTGACLFISKKFFHTIGEFCSDYGMYFEDIDLCMKVRKQGKIIWYEPLSVLVHHESKSSPLSRKDLDSLYQSASVIFYKRWLPEIKTLAYKNALIDRKENIQAVKEPTIVIDGVIFQLQHGRPFGISRLWLSLLTELAATPLAGRIVLLDREGTAPEIPGIRRRKISAFYIGNARNEAETLDQVCREEGGGLFVSTYYTYTLSTPSLLMLYDMIPERFQTVGPDAHNPEWRDKHHAIENSSSFAAISQSTARDLALFYPQAASRPQKVIPCAVSDAFRPHSTDEIAAFKAAGGLSKRYFLLVGRRDAHKNVRLFFQAFAQLPDRERYAIVMAGAGHELEPELRELIAGADGYAGFFSDQDLALLYSGALALVYPSIYEGFGLPILEAMQSGCPVITCHNSSIFEVAGRAALYVGESDVDGMAKTLLDVQQPDVRSYLIKAGLEEAQRFSWKKSAVLLAATINAQL